MDRERESLREREKERDGERERKGSRKTPYKKLSPEVSAVICLPLRPPLLRTLLLSKVLL